MQMSVVYFKHWVPITALFLVVMIPIIYTVAHYQSFKEAYPSEHFSRYNHKVFIAASLSYLVYFVGWEFIFRGFFLFSLREKLGDSAAIVIQMIPFA